MSRVQQAPVVPLRAGAGPENPPCPACGEPLFGWIDRTPGLTGPVRRCESCGLGVVGEAGAPADALATLDLLGGAELVRIANRGGFSAWIGGAGWAGLEPGARYLYTVESVRRLAAHRDQVVAAVRWSAGPGIATMWQTLLNSATFGHNVVIGSAVPAPRTWQRRIDWLTTVVLTIPALVLSLVLEPVAALLRRGSVLSLQLKLL